MFQGAPLTKLIPSKKMNKKVISDQFWDEPEAGRNGVGNGRPEQDLCVFASRRESLFFVSKNGVRCKPVTDRRSVPRANGNNGAPVCRRLKPCLSATPIRSVEGEGVRNPNRHTQSRSQTGAPFHAPRDGVGAARLVWSRCWEAI